MAYISFVIVHKEDPEQIPVKSSHSLKEIWEYIQYNPTIINNPKNWFIEEIENGDFVEACNVNYFIQTYQNIDDVPQCISDMSHTEL